MMKPMLATDADLNDLRFPLFVSVKLDGVRGIVHPEGLLSRSLKPIPNKFVQKFFADHPETNGLDGELIVGDPWAEDVYRKTTSGVMCSRFEPEFRFYVFDNPLEAGKPFTERFKNLQNRLATADPEILSRVVLLGQVLVTDMAGLLKEEEKALKAGYEGLILRSQNAPYKFGRSSSREGYLLKFKRFTDGEAEIIGCEELESNQNKAFRNELGRTARSTAKDGMVLAGCLGAFSVKDVKSGVEFKIGTGFSQADRDDFWRIRAKLIGKIVKYKHFEIGAKDAPRFPVFLGFRDKIDMS